MAESFLENLIKEYKHWAIYVHPNQGYLGRCVVCCKREDALDLIDATPEEQPELFLVLSNLKEAMKKVFQPDWFNYSFLGNETTYLPRNFILEQVLKNPKGLIVWLYENQGVRRFGANNRLFVVLASKSNWEESWKLKKDFDLVVAELDKFKVCFKKIL